MSALMKFKKKSANVQIVKPAETILVNGVPFSRKQVKALQHEGIDLQIDNQQRTYKDTPGQTATYNGTPTLQGPFNGNSNQWGTLSQPGVRPERYAVVPRPMSFMRMLTEQGALSRKRILQ
jgi:hypothetical protein